MKRYIHEQTEIQCMSNVRGKYVTVESVPFSFYYSVANSNHGPRVKVTMNSENMRPNRMSSLKLCDDWSLEQSDSADRISSKELKEMQSFFRRYLVLFLFVWEDKVSEPALGDYLEGKISFSELIEMLDFYSDYSEELSEIETIEELEQFCREYKLVNFYGN